MGLRREGVAAGRLLSSYLVTSVEPHLNVFMALQGPNCVVYSFGSNGQVEFEDEIMTMTQGNCDIHVFDFTLTPALAERVRAVRGVTFHDFGIGATDAKISQEYAVGGHVVQQYELKTLPTIMRDLGHSWVDVFKMDVEGAEYQILPSILQHYNSLGLEIPVTQAQIEYHHWPDNPTAKELVNTLTMMEHNGFRAFHTEFNYNGPAWNFIEYAYLHVRSGGQIVHAETSGVSSWN